MKLYIEKLKNYPIGVCGVALAFITISNCWQLNNIYFLKPIAIIFAIIAILIMISKMIIYPKKVLEELKNPILSSFYPTIDMAAFLIADYFVKDIPKIALLIWLIGIIFHYLIVIWYSYQRIVKFNFKDIMPSWNVVYVGMVVAAVSSKGMGHVGLSKFLVIFGIVAYIVLLPIMLYVVFRDEKMENHRLPTIGILAAPGSLNLAGYLTVFHNPNIYLLWFLIITSLFNLLVVYGYVHKLIRDKFVPTYAAFTFPLAISTLAAYKVSKYFSKNVGLSNLFHLIANIEIFIATTVIFYVLYRFISLFLDISNSKLTKNLKEDELLLEKAASEVINNNSAE